MHTCMHTYMHAYIHTCKQWVYAASFLHEKIEKGPRVQGMQRRRELLGCNVAEVAEIRSGFENLAECKHVTPWIRESLSGLCKKP